MTLEIQAPRLGEAQEGGRVKPVNGIYVRNNNHSFIKKIIFRCKYSTNSKYNLMKCQNMHSEIAGVIT
jgi:hypothetical protein